MSGNYDNTNAGALFKNDQRRTENHPNYRGDLCAECPECGAKTEFWLSAWIKKIKQGKNAGQSMMSLALTAKDSQPEQAPAASEDEFDDDIPF